MASYATIALERNAKVFGGDVFTAAPLVFEIGAFLGENLSKTDPEQRRFFTFSFAQPFFHRLLSK
jgi:hypothetical protein